MSRIVDEEGCPVCNDALIEGKKMTKEEIMKAVDLCFGGIYDCESCPYYNDSNCSDHLPEAMAWLLKDYYKTENSPSDARKGEGWSTISVDENVGSNAAISVADAIVEMGEAFDLFAKATADMLRNKE